jgi:exonuclease VII small subunit
MSAKNNNTVAAKLAELQQQVAWFDGETFTLEEALDKFKYAEKLANEIEKDLVSLKNEVVVLKKRFDQE